MLAGALKEPPLTDEQWKDFLSVVNKTPGYIFDESKRNCPLIYIRVGESNDVFFDKDLIFEIPWKKEERIAALEKELEELRASDRSGKNKEW